VQSYSCYARKIKNVDVHFSSRVANHFFYLLAEGSAPTNGQPGSPTCNGAIVTGIGRDKAGAIWYKALTMYMTSRTDYQGAQPVAVMLPQSKPVLSACAQQHASSQQHACRV